MPMKSLSGGVAAAIGALALGLIPASPATASDSYYVAGTDIGIYPRASTSMDAERIGTALANGSSVSVVCETEGEVVDNGYAPSAVWMQLPDGSFLPNAFVYTGADGWTPGVPRCPDASSAEDATTETPKVYDGLWISNDSVSTQLINHYYDATGAPVVIDWAFFASDATLRDAMLSLEQPLGYTSYNSDPANDGDVYYALGAFTIARTSGNCFAIRDTYDFTPDKPENVPYVFNWADALTGRAAAFEAVSSGCF